MNAPSRRTETARIVEANVRERDALVTVCSACDDGKATRRALKRACKERGLGKRVRVVSVSCLDLCPRRAVAVAIADRGSMAGARYLIVEPTDEAYASVVAMLERSSATPDA